MDEEQVKQICQEIRSRVPVTDYLVKSKGRQYICPFCGSGTGPRKTGAMTVYSDNSWHCFACRRTGDIITLYQQVKGADFQTTVRNLARKINLTLVKPFNRSPEGGVTALRAADRCAAKTQGSINTLPLQQYVLQTDLAELCNLMRQTLSALSVGDRPLRGLMPEQGKAAASGVTRRCARMQNGAGDDLPVLEEELQLGAVENPILVQQTLSSRSPEGETTAASGTAEGRAMLQDDTVALPAQVNGLQTDLAELCNLMRQTLSALSVGDRPLKGLLPEQGKAAASGVTRRCARMQDGTGDDLPAQDDELQTDLAELCNLMRQTQCIDDRSTEGSASSAAAALGVTRRCARMQGGIDILPTQKDGLQTDLAELCNLMRQTLSALSVGDRPLKGLMPEQGKAAASGVTRRCARMQDGTGDDLPAMDLQGKLRVELVEKLNLVQQTLSDCLQKGELTALGASRMRFEAQGGINTLPASESASRAILSETMDYTDYYRRCRGRLKDPAAVSYLSTRGISIETAEAYCLGFDPAADPASAPGGVGIVRHPCPRIIVPSSAAHYMGRSTDSTTDKAFAKLNAKGSKPGIFNLQALYTPEVSELFICEGAFDALSVIEAGEEAIALNSASNVDMLLRQLEGRPTSATLILCLDSDSAGEKAAQTLRQGLDRLNISHVDAAICGDCKDANEALVKDRDAFFQAVHQARLQTAAKPDNTGFYVDFLMREEIQRFGQAVPTGYGNLDARTGGLYAGLYCVAAISSLGKTTFTAQMADQLAAAGQEVLYFSLEQSRLELVSKSLARIIARKNQSGVTSLDIRRGTPSQDLDESIVEYRQTIQDRISIIEGNFNCNVAFIERYIRQYMQRNRVKPIVFIDYLQILQSEDQKSTRETVDSSLTALKRISREQELTIFIISSVNRSNYQTPIDFESLKESGGIEYTCDVVWGLQLQCLNEDLFNGDSKGKVKEKRERIREAKSETPRKIELVCLKNRYGIANFSIFFDYYPAKDLFVPKFETRSDFVYKRV